MRFKKRYCVALGDEYALIVATCRSSQREARDWRDPQHDLKSYGTTALVGHLPRPRRALSLCLVNNMIAPVRCNSEGPFLHVSTEELGAVHNRLKRI